MKQFWYIIIYIWNNCLSESGGVTNKVVWYKQIASEYT